TGTWTSSTSHPSKSALLSCTSTKIYPSRRYKTSLARSMTSTQRKFPVFNPYQKHWISVTILRTRSERQYRELFKNLGRRKNIKAKEKEFVAKKQIERRLKDPGKRDLNFKVGGSRVDQRNVKKWEKEWSKKQPDFGV